MGFMKIVLFYRRASILRKEGEVLVTGQSFLRKKSVRAGKLTVIKRKM